MKLVILCAAAGLSVAALGQESPLSREVQAVAAAGRLADTFAKGAGLSDDGHRILRQVFIEAARKPPSTDLGALQLAFHQSLAEQPINEAKVAALSAKIAAEKTRLTTLENQRTIALYKHLSPTDRQALARFRAKMGQPRDR